MFQRLFAWLTGGRSQIPTSERATSKKSKTKRAKSSSSTAVRGRRQGKAIETQEPGLYTINSDELSEEESGQLPQLMAEQTGMAMFTGKIEHAYDLAFVGAADTCPRCNAPIKQQYATWVYATDRELRAMAAPAGYFCTACPTAIVDQGMLKKGVTRGYTYEQVLGLTSEKKKGFQSFTTWNGEQPIYIIDESG